MKKYIKKYIKKRIQQSSRLSTMAENKPIKVSDIKKGKKLYRVREVIDQYPHLLEELFHVRNPELRPIMSAYSEGLKKFISKHVGKKTLETCGQWFYFPWLKILVHYLPEKLHNEVRTARNKNIVSHADQEKLYNATIAIAGLSVGSHGALTMSMMGMSHHIKLADPDTISASNLNRLHYDFTKIGMNKAEVAAQYMYLMNPYARIDVYSEGITSQNVSSFLSGVDVLIEEMDSLPMKVLIRKDAQKSGVPVLMATDNGTSAIVDVERYDIDPAYPLFHGRVELPSENVAGDLRQKDPKYWNRIASNIIGIEHMEENLILSLMNLGKTISGVPQLGAAASMSGSLLAICAEKILTGKPLASGKYVFSTDAVFVADHYSNASKARRKNVRDQFKKFLAYDTRHKK